MRIGIGRPLVVTAALAITALGLVRPAQAGVMVAYSTVGKFGNNSNSFTSNQGVNSTTITFTGQTSHEIGPIASGADPISAIFGLFKITNNQNGSNNLSTTFERRLSRRDIDSQSPVKDAVFLLSSPS